MREGGRPVYLFFRLIFIFILSMSFVSCKTTEEAQKINVKNIANKSQQTLLQKPAIVKNGDIVAIKYIGRFADGTVFSRSPQGKSFILKVGSSKLVDGFEEALIGMKLNEEKKFVLKAENTYGKYNPKLKRKISKKSIPESVEIKPGVVLSVSNSKGRKLAGVITKVETSDVILDFNHPLAGYDLYFDVKLLGVKKN